VRERQRLRGRGMRPPGGRLSVLRRIGRSEHVLDHLAMPAVSFRQTVTRVMPSFNAPGLMVCPRLREASCWGAQPAAVTSTTVWASTKSEDRPRGARPGRQLYDVERDYQCQPADVRYPARQKFSLPRLRRSFTLVRATASWANRRESNLAKPSLWPQPSGSLQLVPEERSRAPHDNNPAERACDRLESEEKNLAVLPGPTPVQKHSPAP